MVGRYHSFLLRQLDISGLMGVGGFQFMGSKRMLFW